MTMMENYQPAFDARAFTGQKAPTLSRTIRKWAQQLTAKEAEPVSDGTVKMLFGFHQARVEPDQREMLGYRHGHLTMSHDERPFSRGATLAPTHFA